MDGEGPRLSRGGWKAWGATDPRIPKSSHPPPLHTHPTLWPRGRRGRVPSWTRQVEAARMQMILTSFLEVFGVEPPAEERQEVVGKSRVQKPCPPLLPTDPPCPRPRAKDLFYCWLLFPLSMLLGLLFSDNYLPDWLLRSSGKRESFLRKKSAPHDGAQSRVLGSLPSLSPPRVDLAKREAYLCRACLLPARDCIHVTRVFTCKHIFPKGQL